MSGYSRLRLHAERPAARQLAQAVHCLHHGGFAVVLTETTYAMVARPESKVAISAIQTLRHLDRSHLWALMCSDLSQASQFVRMNNGAHRLLRKLLPGPYTFILPATSMIPKRVFGKRQDMGLRIPQLPVCHQLLQQVDSPLLATTMQFADEDTPAYDPDQMDTQLNHHHCVLIDSGWGGTEPTTVVDLCDDVPQLLRAGSGPWPLEHG